MESPTLQKFILGLADDALIYGQRLSEWTSRGPTLEIDIALSNTALSYLGRARFLFSHYSEIKNEGKDEDHYAMMRSEREYLNLWIYEIANGDFAQAVLRQYFIDEFELEYFQKLSQSCYPHLADVAKKTVLESRYSLHRCQNWLKMLALGTKESRERLEQAIQDLALYSPEFFIVSADEASLVEQGYCPDRRALKSAWCTRCKNTLVSLGMAWLETEQPTIVSGGRDGVHSEALGHLLSDLQYMQRTYPGLNW